MRHTMEFVDTRIKQRDGCAGEKMSAWCTLPLLKQTRCEAVRCNELVCADVVLCHPLRKKGGKNNSCSSGVSLASDCFYLSVTLTPFPSSSRRFGSPWKQLPPCLLQRLQSSQEGSRHGLHLSIKEVSRLSLYYRSCDSYLAFFS